MNPPATTIKKNYGDKELAQLQTKMEPLGLGREPSGIKIEPLGESKSSTQANRSLTGTGKYGYNPGQMLYVDIEPAQLLYEDIESAQPQTKIKPLGEREGPTQVDRPLTRTDEYGYDVGQRLYSCSIILKDIKNVTKQDLYDAVNTLVGCVEVLDKNILEYQKDDLENKNNVLENKRSFLENRNNVLESKRSFLEKEYALNGENAENQKAPLDTKSSKDPAELSQFVSNEKIKLKQPKLEEKIVQCKKNRDVVCSEDLKNILHVLENLPSTFVNKRITVALILLYVTGLKVSNLLSLTVQDIKSVLEKGFLPLSQTENNKVCVKLIENDYKLICNFKNLIEIVIKNKNNSDFVFTRRKINDKKLSRETFTKQLNKVLEKASKISGKTFKTHSFRATYISDLLQSSPIDTVNEIIGHKHIKTTFSYKQTNPTLAEKEYALSKLNETRKQKN